MTKLNLLQKLNKIRVDLFNEDLKKTGYNSFGKWHYYELGDFLPFINKASQDIGVLNQISFTADKAFLTIIDCDDLDKKIEFSVPWVDAQLKGATDIQSEGATITYLRRYLYLTAYEIVESDWVDSQTAKENEQAKKDANWKAFISKKEVQDYANKAGFDLTDSNIDRKKFHADFVKFGKQD